MKQMVSKIKYYFEIDGSYGFIENLFSDKLKLDRLGFEILISQDQYKILSNLAKETKIYVDFHLQIECKSGRVLAAELLTIEVIPKANFLGNIDKLVSEIGDPFPNIDGSNYRNN